MDKQTNIHKLFFLSYIYIYIDRFLGNRMAEAIERYPKRKRTVSFRLQPYVLDYNSDDDLALGSEDGLDINESESDISLSGSDELTSPESSMVSLMDQSDEINNLFAKDGTIWSETNSAPNNDIFLHVPSLTTYS